MGGDSHTLYEVILLLTKCYISRVKNSFPNPGSYVNRTHCLVCNRGKLTGSQISGCLVIKWPYRAIGGYGGVAYGIQKNTNN